MVARALGLAAAFRPSARASKGILHTMPLEFLGLETTVAGERGDDPVLTDGGGFETILTAAGIWLIALQPYY